MQKQFRIIFGVTEPEHYTHIIFYYTNSSHWESGIYPLFHGDMPLLLVKFDDSLDLPFSPFLFACSPHVTCYFSFLTLYREITFLGKSTHFLDHNQSGFFTLHTVGKLPIFRCKPHLNWMITSLDISVHKKTDTFTKETFNLLWDYIYNKV